jgi:IS5 family transposase
VLVSTYAGQHGVLAELATLAQDCAQSKGCRNRPLKAEYRRKNRIKSKVRAVVEHIFQVLKRQFGCSNVRYRGFEMNADYLFAAFALVNIILASDDGCGWCRFSVPGERRKRAGLRQ